jgi:hypothetical protein
MHLLIVFPATYIAKHDNLVYLLLTIPAAWSKEKGPLQAGTL